MQNRDRRLIYPIYTKEAVNKAAKRIVSSLNNDQIIDPSDEEIIETGEPRIPMF